MSDLFFSEKFTDREFKDAMVCPSSSLIACMYIFLILLKTDSLGKLCVPKVIFRICFLRLILLSFFFKVFFLLSFYIPFNYFEFALPTFFLTISSTYLIPFPK
jgi:hypothetical protein